MNIFFPFLLTADMNSVCTVKTVRIPASLRRMPFVVLSSQESFFTERKKNQGLHGSRFYTVKLGFLSARSVLYHC